MIARKFRIWNPDLKLMIQGDQWYVIDSKGQLSFLSIHGSTSDGDWLYKKIPLSNQLIYMQYTGIHDKNGKEIYAGDILRTEHGIIDFVEYGYWNCGCCYDVFGYTLHSYRDSWSVHDDEATSDAEVIGNIYENPELIKEEEDETP